MVFHEFQVKTLVYSSLKASCIWRADSEIESNTFFLFFFCYRFKVNFNEKIVTPNLITEHILTLNSVQNYHTGQESEHFFHLSVIYKILPFSQYQVYIENLID